jgi:hypothetical protein
VAAELDVRPDDIVADSGHAITAAVRRTYGTTVGLIPSLFHVHRALRTALLKHPAAAMRVEGRSVLVDALAKHLDALNRDELTSHSAKEWSAWWDALIATAAGLGVPTATLVQQRYRYEPWLAAALPLLARQPQLPASNAAVEVRIRSHLEPFLSARAQQYRNLAPTNFLMDLAVVRDHGAFNDLDELPRQVRAHNESAGGWAAAPRLILDTQPPARPDGTRPQYASLLNPLLVSKLHQARIGSRAEETP